jgi:hypothetical protein
MANNQLFFVQCATESVSTRSRELKDAEARAHAARVGHQRRRKAKVLFLHHKSSNIALQYDRHEREIEHACGHLDRQSQVMLLHPEQMHYHAPSLQTVVTQSKRDAFDCSPVGNIPQHLLSTLHYGQYSSSILFGGFSS